MKTMIRPLTAILLATTLLFCPGCSKTNHIDPETSAENLTASNSVMESSSAARFSSVAINQVPDLCGTTTVKNFIKNSITHGSITMGNDATDYYFSITAQNGWLIKDIRLYAGPDASIPVNPGNGLPQHNEFPVNENMSAPYPGNWNAKVPLADLGDNFWISVRVSFVNGAATQTLWSEGDLFTDRNTASKFQYFLQECIVDEGCGYGQGYWFGNGNQSWPDVNGADQGHVTVGSEFYTRDEARAIWWANNGQCPGIPDAKKTFAFIASIRLSDASVTGNAGLWSDVVAADNWLQGLDRLSPDNICNQPAAPAAVKEAVARIGDWLDEHNCN